MNFELPVPVLAESLCALSRAFDEARESTESRLWQLNAKTLAAGNSSLLQVPAWLALVPQP